VSQTSPGAAVVAPRVAWLRDESGAKRRVRAEGLVIGRAAGADLVVSDERSSKRQALVRPGAGGLELHHLGRNDTTVNGVAIEGAVALATGDLIEVPGGSFLVQLQAPAQRNRAEWLVQLGQHLHRVPRRFRIGGGAQDDLCLEGLPDEFVTLHSAPDGLLLDGGGTGVSIDGVEAEPESITILSAGSLLRLGDHDLQVRLEGEAHGHTTQLGDLPTLKSARLAFLPNGADLTLVVGRERLTCRLSELRARLVGILLKPPTPLCAGEFVPDEIVLPGVWPRQPDRSHYDVNTLVHRLRKDLLRAGASPTRFVERARGGGGTRFCVDPRSVVTVE